MRKFYTVGIAFAAMFAFCAVAARAAFAESEWLLNGEALQSSVSTETKILLFLKDTHTGTKVHCAMTLDGPVGPASHDETTSVLDAAKGEVTAVNPLTCTIVERGVCIFATSASFYPTNLPWKTEILLAGSGFRDDLINAGYVLTCESVGVDCVLATSAKLTNVTEGVLEVFDEASENGSCSDGGEALLRGEGTTTSLLDTLTVS